MGGLPSPEGGAQVEAAADAGRHRSQRIGVDAADDLGRVAQGWDQVETSPHAASDVFEQKREPGVGEPGTASSRRPQTYRAASHDDASHDHRPGHLAPQPSQDSSTGNGGRRPRRPPGRIAVDAGVA